MALSRAYANKNVIRARFKAAPFVGRFLRSFGRPELSGAWLIYGGSGVGKTTFTLQLAKYLANFKKVAFNSLEQGMSLSLQRAWERVNMEEAGRNVILLNKEQIPDLYERLRGKHAPDIVIFDSVHYLTNFHLPDYQLLRLTFPKKLFIFVSHEKRSLPDGKVAERIRYDADIKMHVEGFKVFVTSRFEEGDGIGGEPFIIWEEGAARYWADRPISENEI